MEAIDTTVASRPAEPRWQHLTGGTAIWIFMTLEVATFGMFFLWFAWSWGGRADVYAESQALLDVGSGLLGTALLLVGSWAAYQGVLANAADRSRATAGWFGAGAAAGVLFSLNKLLEYAAHADHGITLSTNGFWFAYLFLTKLHLLHVIGGVGALLVIGTRAARGRYGARNALTVEAVAAYWHLVDVIWIFLFPLLYVVSP